MAKSSNKWLERYTDGGLYIPLEGTSYVVRQQISKPRTYGDGGKYLTVNGEYHRVYENAEGDIMVNHPKEDKGKWDTINLTQKAKAKTIAQGIAATKKWHRENPEYANGGLGDGDPVKPVIPQNFVPIKWDAKTQKENELLQKSINERTKNTPEFKKARKLTKEEQDYSDKVKARIENPSADLGILAANMASALTRLQYLTPDEIKKITNNPKATTELAADILGQGLTNELIGGAVTVAPQAIKSVGKYLTEGPLKNTSKLNPWAYQYNLPKNVMWRGLGQEGMEDAINSGVFRSKQNVIPEYYPGTKLQANKSFGTNPYFTPNFNTAANYGDNFIAEVPKDVVNWKNRYGKGKTWSQIANKPIPIEQGRILQKHWLKGYKEVPKPTFISDLNFLTSSINPKNLKSQSGLNWMKQWYNDPKFQERYRLTNSELVEESKIPQIIQENIIQNLNNYQPKNYLDLLKDKGLKEYLKNSISTGGLSYGHPQNIYINRTMYPFNKKGLESIRTHELTHLIEHNGFLLNPADEQALLKPFGISSIKDIPKNPGFFRREILGDVPEYYIDPSEIHARMNQARFDLNLSPKDKFTEKMFDKISKQKNWYGMNKYIKDKKSFIDLMNKFWAIAPIGVAGAEALQQKEKGGWLNKYEQGGYADDSAVLNSEGQEVNTMQFALPTVPTFNFGNGDGDGEDPKNKKKSKDKKTDTRTVAQKRHDALEAAKTKILKTESPENKKKMDMLYSTTIAAENTYGYDPKAYGRKKQTRSPMSIDNIALDELFNPKGEKNRYTLQQKSNFDLLRSLGLPTDKAKLKELLETDDAYAGLGVAKTLYYNEGALKNLPNPTDTAAYINLYLDEYNKKGALKYQKRNELIDNITNKMRAQGKRETKTIKPVVKNKTTK